MAAIIDNLTSSLNILEYINPFGENFILNGLIKFFNPLDENFIFSDLFSNVENIWSGLISIVDWINPFSENFFGYGLMDLLSNLLTNLFVPNEESFIQLQDTFNAKLGFVDVIKKGIEELQVRLENMNSGARSAYPNITVEINSDWYTGSVVIFDCYWFANYINQIHMFITGFCYIFFIWRLYINLPNIISGINSFIDIGGLRQ